MARPLRIACAGAFYHVTARGNERQPTYRDDHDRWRFLDRPAAIVARQALRIHAFGSMRNAGRALKRLDSLFKA
jgi:REP-associated tyrosine transposase